MEEAPCLFDNALECGLLRGNRVEPANLSRYYLKAGFSRENGMARDVAMFIGSLRKDSLNRKLAMALQQIAPAGLALDEVPIADLPLYNPDLDGAPLEPWTVLRARVRKADAVLFVTPEHNRSVPAAMKNALDIASRPYGQNSWNGKPGAVVSASPGAIGGFGANHHLRQSLVFLNVPTLQQPEVYVGGADKLFDGEGRLVNDGTRKFLAGFLAAFESFIAANEKR
jgi:chromate reductase